MGTDTMNECPAVVRSCQDGGQDKYNDAEPCSFALGPCKGNVGINPMVDFQWATRREGRKGKSRYLLIPPQTRQRQNDYGRLHYDRLGTFPIAIAASNTGKVLQSMKNSNQHDVLGSFAHDCSTAITDTSHRHCAPMAQVLSVLDLWCSTDIPRFDFQCSASMHRCQAF